MGGTYATQPIVFVAAKNREEAREVVHEYLMDQIALGLVGCRTEMLTALKDVGVNVVRQGPHYLTVTVPETDMRIRLKGGIYDASWRLEDSRPGADDRRAPDSGRHREERVRGLVAEFEQIRAKRAEYNRKRYPYELSGFGPISRNDIDSDAKDGPRAIPKPRKAVGDDSLHRRGIGDRDNAWQLGTHELSSPLGERTGGSACAAA